jgi:hypothetical protein
MSLDELAKLWASGATLSEIEQATGVTRGVAIGRIHRARKPGGSPVATWPRRPGFGELPSQSSLRSVIPPEAN